jgi:hypothetical protein
MMVLSSAVADKQRPSEPLGLGTGGRRQTRHWGTLCLPKGVLKASSRNWPARGESSASKVPDAIRTEEPGKLIYYQTDATSMTYLPEKYPERKTSDTIIKSKFFWGLAVQAQLSGMCPRFNSRPVSKTCFLTVRTFLPAAFPVLQGCPWYFHASVSRMIALQSAQRTRRFLASPQPQPASDRATGLARSLFPHAQPTAIPGVVGLGPAVCRPAGAGLSDPQDYMKGQTHLEVWVGG